MRKQSQLGGSFRLKLNSYALRAASNERKQARIVEHLCTIHDGRRTEQAVRCNTKRNDEFEV